MRVFVVVFTALAFSWFGQLPPHGEAERDLLAFLLFFLLAAGAGWRWHATAGAENAGGLHRLVPGGATLFLALWLGLLVLVSLQWLLLPAEIWSGRQAMSAGWLLAGAFSVGLGVMAAPSPTGSGRGGAAWQAVALGIVIAALFNTLVAGLQVVLNDALPPWLPATPVAGRGYGALLQPNLTATLLVLGLVSLSSCLKVARLASRKAAFLAAAVAVVLGAGVALTGSRTGLVLLLLWSLAQVWRCGWTGRRGLSAGWPLLGLALVLLASLAREPGADLTTALDRGAAMSNGRLLIYANALRIGEAFPWLGAGFNQLSFWHADLPYQPKMPGYLTHAHNLLLHFWAEMGLVGLVWVSALLLCLAWPLRRWREAAAWDESRRWGLSVLVVLLLHSMTELPLWSAPFLLLFGLAAGCWLAASDGPVRAGRISLARLGQICALAGLVGALATVGVYRDYLKVSALYDGARWPAVQSGDVAQRANSSLFFHPAAEFAAANSNPVTAQNAAAFARTLPGLWRYVTDARMYEWQLRTDGWQGNAASFAYHAQRFAWLYPDEYAAFRAQLTAEQAQAPWTGFSPVWP